MRSTKALAVIVALLVSALSVRLLLYVLVGDRVAMADPTIYLNRTGWEVAPDVWLGSWILTLSLVVLYCGHALFRRTR